MDQKLSKFIERAIQVHGNRYDYSKVNYTSNKAKVTIICPDHGEFTQIPTSHLHGHGCPLCAVSKRQTASPIRTTEDFVKKALSINGYQERFDYSKTDYTGNKNKLTIICRKHGEFTQNPYNHIYGSGCQKCRSSKLETNMRRILTENNIVFDEQKSFDWLRFRYPLRLDFYIPELNVAIECQGAQHYYFTDFFQAFSVNNFAIAIKRDMTKLLLCLQHGIKIVYTRKKYEPTDIEKVLSLFTDKTAYLKHYDRIIARMKRNGIDTEEVNEIYDELKKCVTSF